MHRHGRAAADPSAHGGWQSSGSGACPSPSPVLNPPAPCPVHLAPSDRAPDGFGPQAARAATVCRVGAIQSLRGRHCQQGDVEAGHGPTGGSSVLSIVSTQIFECSNFNFSHRTCDHACDYCIGAAGRARTRAVGARFQSDSYFLLIKVHSHKRARRQAVAPAGHLAPLPPAAC